MVPSLNISESRWHGWFGRSDELSHREESRNSVKANSRHGCGAIVFFARSQPLPFDGLEAVGYGGGDGFVDFFDGEVAFDEDDAGGFAGGDLTVLFPDAAVEGVLFSFKAAFVETVLRGDALVAPAGAGQAGFETGEQQEGEVGLEVGAEEAVQLEDGRGAELTASALVGLGGVGEAVAEDDFAGVEGGLDHFGDGLGAVGEHEGHFSHGGEAGGARIEHEGADAVAEGRAAGLAGDDYIP
jgi:hypothetical protein